MLSSNTTKERFNSTRRTEGRDLYNYLTGIISDIGEFSHLIDCHGVCGNNNQISLVIVLHTTKAIPIKCFVSHRPPSREGRSVGQKKRNEDMKGSEGQ